MMASRDNTRKHGNREQLMLHRNTAKKLIKHGKIQRVLNHLKNNLGPKSIWQED